MLERLLFLCEKYPLDFISQFSGGLPVIFGVVRYKYLSSVTKLILIFFILYFVKESVALWLSILRENNLYLQNIEIIIETWILLAIALLSFKSSGWKQLLLFLAVLCSLVSFLTYESDTVSSISLSSFRLFSIFICLSYFNKTLTDIRIKNILLHTMFWFTAGLLVYSAGTFFIMLFSEYWYKDINKVSAEIFDKYWNLSQMLFIVFCLLSSYGIWVSKYDQENLI